MAADDQGGNPLVAMADAKFAHNVRVVRERQGQSKAALAAELQRNGLSNFHPTTVARLEAGERRVTVGEAVVISSVLGLDLETMLERHGTDEASLTFATAEARRGLDFHISEIITLFNDSFLNQMEELTYTFATFHDSPLDLDSIAAVDSRAGEAFRLLATMASVAQFQRRSIELAWDELGTPSTERAPQWEVVTDVLAMVERLAVGNLGDAISRVDQIYQYLVKDIRDLMGAHAQLQELAAGDPDLDKASKVTLERAHGQTVEKALETARSEQPCQVSEKKLHKDRPDYPSEHAVWSSGRRRISAQEFKRYVKSSDIEQWLQEHADGEHPETR